MAAANKLTPWLMQAAVCLGSRIIGSDDSMLMQPAVVLDKKADLLSTLKDKLLPAAAPPPPAPIAISGAPLSTTSVVRHFQTRAQCVEGG